MAFNQASFILFPPRHGPVVSFSPFGKHVSGKPLAVLSNSLVDPRTYDRH
jgi:hypothetical protein